MLDDLALVQSDLRFLLPIRAGQSVTILGDAPHLASALVSENVSPIMILPDEAVSSYREVECRKLSAGDHVLPFPSESVDHVIVPQLFPSQTDWLLAELQRVLKPRGWLLVGIQNRHGLQRLRFWKKRKEYSSSTIALSSLERRLRRLHLNITHIYGVSDNLKHPQFVVPLESQYLVKYFFDQIFVPNSWSGQLAWRLATIAIAFRMQKILFQDLALLGQKQSGGS